MVIMFLEQHYRAKSDPVRSSIVRLVLLVGEGEVAEKCWYGRIGSGKTEKGQKKEWVCCAASNEVDQV
jgi:hypothetical protein